MPLWCAGCQRWVRNSETTGSGYHCGPDVPPPRVVSVPAYDTGIGREAGYENDAALVAAHEAELAELSPEERRVVDFLSWAETMVFVSGVAALRELKLEPWQERIVKRFYEAGP